MIDSEVRSATSASVPVHLSSSGPTEPGTWQLAVETPVQITVNDLPFTVMLATPAALADLAIGLLLTGQVIESVEQIHDLDVALGLAEAQVRVRTAPGAVRAERVGHRAGPGTSGCGLCGIETLAQLETRVMRSPAPRPPVTDDAVCHAWATLPSWQPLNAETRSVHAAAWCTSDGEITLAREDVGRHNALDKLVGAMAMQRRLGEAGFVVMSSRCSYELVAKASFTNASLLATISAPTTMALHWARTLALPVVSAIRHADAFAVVRFDQGEPSGALPFSR